ncbi:MAG: HD domain-containing protein [Chlamydiales bacterium]|nr:HD domain-containing protein [Chlamydiales bacterium]
MFKVVYRGVLMLACLSAALLVAVEKNSTPCFQIGEVGSSWEFPSDHLPVGCTINDIHIASWNVLDVKYLRWIENNNQGLKNSSILRDNQTVQDSDLTVRDQTVLSNVMEMIQHETHPRSVIALEEVGDVFFEHLQKIIPKNMHVVTAGDSFADIFLYDSNRFDFIGSVSGHYPERNNTWLKLMLRERSSGQHYVFINSHVPGGEISSDMLKHLAQMSFDNFDPTAITIIMGDQNRSPDYFLAHLETASKALGYREQPFKALNIPYPTHVNTLMEASWIDNIFVAAPSWKPLVLSVASSFHFMKSLPGPVEEMWRRFPLNAHIHLARQALSEATDGHVKVMNFFNDLLWQEWVPFYLSSEHKLDLPLLLEAVVMAAAAHEGQVRKDSAATPYIIHPMIVCKNVWTEGKVRNINILIAALLHDTLEDTDISREEIVRRFGARVLQTIEEVTNDPSLSTNDNKQRQIDHAPHMSLDAQIVKIADRIANIRDLAEDAPVEWTEEKIQGYYGWGQKLLDVLFGCNEGLEQALKAELAR